MADPAVLCIFCCRRDDLGDGDGCRECREARAVDEYLQQDKPQIQKRQDRWAGWTASQDHARERQRRHRLLARTKPRERARPGSDPLEIAFDCLEELARMRQALKSNVAAREHLDQAEELVRRLGWGPQPAPSLPKAEVKIPPGRIGMHNRWHVKEGKPCNCPPALAEALRSRP